MNLNQQQAIADLQALTIAGHAFTLPLNDGALFASSHIVRRVLSKRLVCAGLWQGKQVYAKIFVGNKATDYAMRDAIGIAHLTHAGILTPSLLHDEAQPAAHILIFEAIALAQNAESIWLTYNKHEQLALAKKLVHTVATHHQAGIIQTDLYLKNFLVQGENIYTLDGDGIRKYTHLSDAQAKHNLSVLLSKFDVLDVVDWLPSLLTAYQQTRGDDVKLDVNALQNLSRQQRINAASHYADKKVFRQCSDISVGVFPSDSNKDSTHFSAVTSAYVHLHLPQNSKIYDALIDNNAILKNGNTCTVAQLNVEGVLLAIKRYNIKNSWHRLGRMLRKSRAAISWANAHRLHLLGIATPRPVALLEERHFTLRGKAYFLSEYIDAPDMVKFFKNTTDKTLRAEVVKQMVQLLYRLYLLNISHGDMKANNIKVKNEIPMLIDLDSMRQHHTPYFAQKAHVRDLRRFMQNWQHDTSLYNAFLKVFKVVYVDHTPLIKARILND